MPPLRKLPAEIANLSDQELAEQLLQYSYCPGPILPTTRPVYERKLFLLQTGEQASPTVQYEPADNDEEDDSQEADAESTDDEEVVLKQQQPRQRTTKTTKTEVRKTPPRQPATARSAPSYSASKSQSAQSVRSKKEVSSSSSKGGLPLWVKFLAILIVAVLVFLVVKNMESDPASEVPDIPEELEFNV